MGKIKHISKIRKLTKETPVFQSSDIERTVGDKNYAHLLLHNLVERGEVFRVKKGWYSIEEDPTLAVYCFKPAYLALQNALSIHGLWEQETNPVIVTAKRARTGVRKIFEQNVIIHRIKPDYLFGFDYLQRNNYLIPVSDIEKTFIDLIYFNKNINKELIDKIRKNINISKLNSYLKKYPKKFKNKVIKFIK